jgi:hypothetical protein
MIHRFAATAALLMLLTGATAPGQEGKANKPTPPAPAKPAPNLLVVPLAPAAPAERMVRNPLLPDPLDITPGNAAQLWITAGLMTHEEQRKLKPDDYRWFFNPKPEEEGTFPPKEAKQLLDRFARPLRVADQAARRAFCDWERPPLTFQNMRDDGALIQSQYCRELARFLLLRFRVELSERRFDKAVYSLQTGLTMARHLGNGGTLVEFIVGNALGAIYFSGVQEWMRTPGSPDLYWSLTALPSPFLDLHATCVYELNTLYRSFPALSRLKLRRDGERLTASRVDHAVDELLAGLDDIAGHAGPKLLDRALLAVMAARSHESATKYLLDRGWTEERLKAAAPLAVVLTYFVGQYDEACGEVLKWLTVPPWQGRDEAAMAANRAIVAAKADGNLLIAQLFPVIDKSYQAWLRTERLVATLRTAEALRGYAAAHGGTAPAKLSDITAVPPPIDPDTGKGFDDMYAIRDGKAVLEVSPRGWVWRFEMPAGK